MVVRTSSTEPKLKTYISVSAQNREEVVPLEIKMLESLKDYFE